ncbi:hypothetical protein DPMN_144392 [Dreissena polymorpha]|uniref:Uncharacterized protein n=1 Tax=Dreissena polymorpha TaxID=45954 RepID=A0A9D4GFJ1_DREPO|nr:hypothetical protein DPMN_144392 [Dreissena polymorpha]
MLQEIDQSINSYGELLMFQEIDQSINSYGELLMFQESDQSINSYDELLMLQESDQSINSYGELLMLQEINQSINSYDNELLVLQEVRVKMIAGTLGLGRLLCGCHRGEKSKTNNRMYSYVTKEVGKICIETLL